MSQWYELVVFTAADQQYADEVINRLDEEGLIAYRLYRQHVVHLQNNRTEQQFLIKDLARLGRPLEKTIIIDNLKENFCWQKSNGIQIKSYYNDSKDSELLELIPKLTQIAQSETEDVREVL
jgi:CTD small phosphatase-like protein 2